ncbi:spore cortex protein CoxA [Rossellomorea vietnamensis]|uniref:Spore cortex protein CoxA n=2 Tax=Rossellomorea TaxID=2837508 RepID=A0A5D4KHX7_9BACI|nr:MULTISPECIES: YhcN/YlaJ family sporulation lipoprotein [Rossellomorea]TYR76808.1 spore cortex protein CoxA [Rossellomorea vietnamensis]TYS84020.1 spore cortex protein CoxA [Rossellomorea aquimaris]
MHKKLLLIPLSAILLGACNGADDAAGGQGADSYEPMGFYSNEGHGNDKNEDRDGPITEWYDHSIGQEGQAIREGKRRYLHVRDTDGNPQNPSKPLAEDDRNFFLRDERASHGDANYHGHLDDNTREARRSYYTAYEGDLAEKIGDVTASIENVNDVRSVTYGTNVLIAVDLEDDNRFDETEKKIERAVQPYLKGRTVTVASDEGTFSRIRNIDNDLRDGGPREAIQMDIHDILRSIRGEG